MLPQPGYYDCYAGERGVYETKGGALMFSIKCLIDQQTNITAYQCLVSKEGAVMQRTVDTLKEVFGWDGVDVMWLQEADLSQVQFNIKVDASVDSRDGKDTVTVSFINPLGGGSNGPNKGDRNEIMAKYGAKFRALSGGSPMQQPQKPPQPQQQAQQQQQAAPPAPGVGTGSALTLPPTAPPSNMQEAWDALCQNAPEGTTQDGMTELWTQGIGLIGKPQNSLSGNEWGLLKQAFVDFYNTDSLPL